MLSEKIHIILRTHRLKVPFYSLTKQSTIRYDSLTTHYEITNVIYQTQNDPAYLQHTTTRTKSCIMRQAQ